MGSVLEWWGRRGGGWVAVVVLAFACDLHAQASEGIATPRLYWSTEAGGLQRVSVDDPESIETVFADHLHDSRAITVDAANGHLYIRQETPDRILRCDVDGSNLVEFASGRSREGKGIDFDPVDGMVYWVDRLRVRRMSTDGSIAEAVVYDTGIDRRRGNAVFDRVGRSVYWISAVERRIRRLDLDGGVPVNVFSHPGLASSPPFLIDGGEARLYALLGSRIGSVGLDGSNPRLVYRGTDIEAFALDRVGGKVYWEDAGTVYRANTNGSGIETLFEGDYRSMVFDDENQVLYALDATDRGPVRVDIASGAMPEYLWDTLPQRVEGEVEFDEVSGRIYWHDQVQLMRASLDGDRVQRLVSSGPAKSIALDGAGRMYWYDSDAQRIKRSRLDGTEIEEVPLNLHPSTNIEIDRVHAKLYLTPEQHSSRSLVRANFDGSNLEGVLGGHEASDVEIDADGGFVYISRAPYIGSGSIARTSLDLQTSTTLHWTSGPVRGIALDAAAGKLYWVEHSATSAGPNRIGRMNLDGTGVEDFLLLPDGADHRPRGLAIETQTPIAELACRVGNVHADGSGLVDVLLVNGSAGDANREMSVAGGAMLRAEMLSPPAADGRAFLVHANLTAPNATTVTRLPLELGRICFPIRLTAGAMPAAIWNGIGRPEDVGASTGFGGHPIADPGTTPFEFLTLPAGDPVNLPVGTTVTFQGVVEDPSSAALRPFGVTNAVVVRIE